LLICANIHAIILVCPRHPETCQVLIRNKEKLMADIKYEIVKQIGVLSKADSGWTKELNLISWNDREPKYDLRDWSADHEKIGKGVTLTREELAALRELLNSMEL
jgi:hypothetical protein